MLLLSFALAADIREPLTELVSPIVDEGLVGALVVAVIADGEVRYLSFGRMSHDGTRVADKSSGFEIGSVSKVFTGLLLAEAVRRGEVRLSDPASKHLGIDLPTWQGVPITLLDLATHTSGLPRLPPSFDPPDPTDPYATATWASVESSLAGLSLDDKPGNTYLYSNLGVAILGEALSKAAGQTYAQLVEQRITLPLRMDSTTVDASEVIEGHDPDGQAVPPWTLQAYAPAGGLHSTPRDLARFVAAHLNPSSELEPSINLAVRRHRPLGSHGSIGLLWHRTSKGVVWHNGQTGGFHSLIAFKPDSQVGIIALGDTATDRVDQIGFAALQLVVGQQPDPIPVTRSVSVDPEVLASYPGLYGPTSIELIDGALWLQLPDQPRHRLWAESNSSFFLRTAPVKVRFEGKRLLFDQEGLPHQEWRRRR